MATKPSLALIPSGYKANQLYSVLPSNGDGDFDFSRGSTATRINKDGLIENVDANVPRLNYPLIDGVVSGCPSLLIEPQRTNLITYSEDFSNSYWTKTRAVVTANQTVSPDGSQTADKYRLDCTSNRSQISRVIYTVGTQYTTSLFVKYDSIQYFYISNAGASAYRVVFDIENGTIISTGSSVDASKIENYGNGWYRCSATFTAAYTTLYYKLSPNSNNATFTNTTDFSYIWGTQIEAGSYPTSYIPTQGSVVTRLADSCSQTVPDGVIGQTEGTIYLEIKPNATLPSYTQRVITLYENSSNLINFQLGGSNEFTFVSIKSGESPVIITKSIPALNLGSFNKVAVSIQSNEFIFYINGIKVGQDVTSGKSMPIVSNIIFANYNSSNPFLGNIKDLTVYNTALTDAELQALTS